MKLSNAFGLLIDLRFAFQIALLPTFWSVLSNPWLLLSPAKLSRTFMAHLWTLFGDGVDKAAKGVKTGLVPPNAYGVVLDIGAGYGHTAAYLDRGKVTKYIALEPNVLMHSEIRKRANQAGFKEDEGTLLILSHGAQNTALICASIYDSESSSGSPQSTTDTVDTLISILTFCSVPSPQTTLRGLVDHVLKPGGTLLFYEHVLNPHSDVAWWQWFWTPLWQMAFDGCRLDRPTDVWIDEMPVWEKKEVWGKDGEDVESLFRHRVGKYVKQK